MTQVQTIAAKAPPAAADDAALAALFRQHAPFIMRTVARLTGPGPHVDDLTHDTFIIAHRKLGHVVSLPEPRGWLYRVAVNLVRHQRRSTARRLRAHERLELQAHVAAETQDTPNPEVAASRAETVRDVRACVSKLPLKLREVFVLYELENVAGEDIATMMQLPINTVWSRLSRARKRFKRDWERHLRRGGQ